MTDEYKEKKAALWRFITHGGNSRAQLLGLFNEYRDVVEGLLAQQESPCPEDGDGWHSFSQYEEPDCDIIEVRGASDSSIHEYKRSAMAMHGRWWSYKKYTATWSAITNKHINCRWRPKPQPSTPQQEADKAIGALIQEMRESIERIERQQSIINDGVSARLTIEREQIEHKIEVLKQRVEINLNNRITAHDVRLAAVEDKAKFAIKGVQTLTSSTDRDIADVIYRLKPLESAVSHCIDISKVDMLALSPTQIRQLAIRIKDHLHDMES